MIAIVTNMYHRCFNSRLEESQKPMETEPGVNVEAVVGAGEVVAVVAAGKEINPTKHNWKNSCEFSREYLVFVINNRADFCCP